MKLSKIKNLVITERSMVVKLKPLARRLTYSSSEDSEEEPDHYSAAVGDGGIIWSAMTDLFEFPENYIKKMGNHAEHVDQLFISMAATILGQDIIILHVHQDTSSNRMYILHPGDLFSSGERSQENPIFVAIVAYYEQIRFGSDLSRIKLKNGKQPFTKVVGHGGKGRVDRAAGAEGMAGNVSDNPGHPPCRRPLPGCPSSPPGAPQSP